MFGHVIGAVETLEKVFATLGWNTDPIIADRKKRFTILAHQRYLHRTTFGRIFKGVAEQIGLNLIETVRIAFDFKAFGSFQIDLMAFGSRLHTFDRAAYQVGQIEKLGVSF